MSEDVRTEEMVSEEVVEETVSSEATASAPSDAKWYVVHTYAGYENKVRENIRKAIENQNLSKEIFEVKVPVETTIEIRNGKKREVERKLFPGYVLINMIMNDKTWYVVRNTRGVTGFVGPGSKPVPLTDEEMRPYGINAGVVTADFEEGDTVSVIAGVWKDTVGVVSRMDNSKQVATIHVELFGRETPVEISYAEMKKLS